MLVVYSVFCICFVSAWIGKCDKESHTPFLTPASVCQNICCGIRIVFRIGRRDSGLKFWMNNLIILTPAHSYSVWSGDKERRARRNIKRNIEAEGGKRKLEREKMWKKKGNRNKLGGGGRRHVRLEGETEKEKEICEMKTQLGLSFFCCRFQLALKAMEDSRGVFQCFVSDLLVVFIIISLGINSWPAPRGGIYRPCLPKWVTVTPFSPPLPSLPAERERIRKWKRFESDYKCVKSTYPTYQIGGSLFM